MYEIDVTKFTIKTEGLVQEFSIEDYNYETELFLNDCMDYISQEIVTDMSFIIYHNRIVKHLEIKLSNYSVSSKEIE